jgi:hypothetical protein
VVEDASMSVMCVAVPDKSALDASGGVASRLSASSSSSSDSDTSSSSDSSDSDSSSDSESG